MIGKIKYEFSGKIWRHAGGSWHFVALPREMSAEIRENLKWQEEGWGRLKAASRIGNTAWDTAIWFDTRQKTYLLPIKAEIRRSEGLEPGQEVTTILWI
jgi:hypothetical protein